MATNQQSVTGRRGSGRVKTRELLMDVAARLFAEKGYPETTVPDIVKEARVGHGTFYEYFGSRREILVAITERARQTNARRPQSDGDAFADQVRLDIAWYLENYVEHLALSQIWHAASNFDPEVAEIVRKARRDRTAQVRAAFEAAGLEHGIDLGVTAVALTAMLEEFAHRWFAEGEGSGTSPDDVRRAADTVSTLTLRALGQD